MKSRCSARLLFVNLYIKWGYKIKHGAEKKMLEEINNAETDKKTFFNSKKCRRKLILSK